MLLYCRVYVRCMRLLLPGCTYKGVTFFFHCVEAAPLLISSTTRIDFRDVLKSVRRSFANRPLDCYSAFVGALCPETCGSMRGTSEPRGQRHVVPLIIDPLRGGLLSNIQMTVQSPAASWMLVAAAPAAAIARLGRALKSREGNAAVSSVLRPA